jgi:type IV secretory pathway TraG/TraD family ATPase VirD4
MPFILLAWYIWHRIQKDRKQRREAYQNWQSYDPPNTHGYAQFADASMLSAAGAFEDRNGIPVGYFDGRPVFHNDATSILTFGKSGVGKGTEVLIPALLQCPNLSFVVPDIDGEAFNVTAEQRLKYGPVYVIDAYDMFPGVLPRIPRAKYNPAGLPWLDPRHPQFVPRCGKLGAGIVPKSDGRDQYWNLGARQITTDILMPLRKYARNDEVSLTRLAEIINGDLPREVQGDAAVIMAAALTKALGS